MSDAGDGSKGRVLVTREVPGALVLQGFAVDVLGDGPADRGSLLGAVGGASALVTMYTDRVDAELLDAAGGALRVVCNFAVGYDNIGLDLCLERGVVVCNTPDAVTEGTANIAFLLLLACARRLVRADRYARSDAYPQNGPLGMSDFLGMDLAGKTLLIVGAGRIGYATASRAKALGMNILYVARSRHLEFEMSPLAAHRVDLHEGLRIADAVSVHTPLSDATRHLIGAPEFDAMKQDAILVNTSRGPVVDERALVDVLKSGKLWGAGLDVFEEEPKLHPELVTDDRCVLTPHIGSAEIRWREAMTSMVCENIRAVFEGREPPTRIA